MVEDRLLKGPQRGTWLDTPILDQTLAAALIDGERLGLAAAAVQGHHQLPAEAFAVGVSGDQPLQLRDESGVPAQLQIGVDALLERRQPELFEGRDLRLREGLVGEIHQRRSPPQPQRRAQRAALCPRQVRQLPRPTTRSSWRRATPGCWPYIYLRADGRRAASVQVHPDPDSMDFFLKEVIPEHGVRAHEFLEQGSETSDAFGILNDAIQEQIRQYGVTLNVSPHHLGGFTRLQAG